MSLNQSVDFLLELETLKGVYRKSRVKADNNRHENSAEHSWNLAIAAQVLQNFVDIDVDIDKVIRMLLIHDIVEIYAGDLFAFETDSAQKHQNEKEHKAINQFCELFDLTATKTFSALWLEFDACQSNEAKFALAVDRIMPFIQNMHNKGGSWIEHQVTKSQILKRNQILKEISEPLWQYLNKELESAIASGWVINK